MKTTRPGASQREDSGFTLVELLVVVIIIGVLAAIAIPVFLNQRQKGYDAHAQSDLRNMANAEETYLTDYFVYTSDITALETQGFRRSINVNAWTAVPTADARYVLTACSQSGKKWQYDSAAGLSRAGTCTY